GDARKRRPRADRKTWTSLTLPAGPRADPPVLGTSSACCDEFSHKPRELRGPGDETEMSCAFELDVPGAGNQREIIERAGLRPDAIQIGLAGNDQCRRHDAPAIGGDVQGLPGLGPECHLPR